MLHGKKVLLGITGSIAAYKSAHLVRLFVKAGAEVRVVMTEAATEFVTPLTLSTLSKNPVLSSFTNDETGNSVWNNHVELGLWADLFVVAPASSNTLSKMASGQCDNLLTATYASAKCPVFFAPAMDLDMHAHPANGANISALQSFGNHLIPSEVGELASGLSGEGRMAEPENIIQFIEETLRAGLPLSGKRVLINGGPTYEAIDAVRFIGNHSTGKMAIGLAKAALELGAQVHLILGPTSQNLNRSGLTLERVVSTDEMHEAVMKALPKADIIILSAAVSDYKPAEVLTRKQKKSESNWSIALVPTVDILSDVGQKRTSGQFLTGFALETNNEEEYAQSKLEKKKLDLIVLNSLRDSGAGFGHDTNKVILFDRNKNRTELPLMSKDEVAVRIFEKINELHA
ncbi:bifunctional phosphopantothenoylcysteine decarboxylase/phosphopantothenate--cysteine ligase CoaBC [Phaeocystidibacter marisrubri]|uniref:Coenzyme A biosynthesis bifunctional protein CoaBC n=1 Tax=Phaeocystidibacter marisrubri TaxID=1577780 RepID=A0A6L3ZKR7_9FLAO|nr:bifunctional phosphopantothenoylcysteine decarboxylase/phosphopantothenate--cysteine ligase CoaBC [Phaeocystidibacter marisrubri]KAB2817760.1 bifunctional phosphopantothenoylcysteine decarboxylase/phosphopantothenate--cysteine ligase CoaBC [Phaeocystidibacter marisrubri]GGH73696.1 phosphopantothenoylcysteine decarboxylase [Phaeocystidibacter marisrubri]